MSAERKYFAEGQPESFAFTDENLKKAEGIVARYPAGRQASAVMPLLDLAQRQSGGWLPRAAMDVVARMLEMPPVRVYEVATFYTMYKLHPVGKHVIGVCTTTPCWLRGSDKIMAAVCEKTGCAPGETSTDGLFTVEEVECLGACVNAPMVVIGDDYFEDLDQARIGAILDQLKQGKPVTVGPQSGRRGSENGDGPTVLKDMKTGG